MLKRLARIRVPLGFALAALVFYLATPSRPMIVVGFPIALVGLLFRGAAAGIIRKNTVLAREGPYRVTRNPLYFGSFLLALGFGVMSNSLLAAILLLVPSALIYPVVIKEEEAHLRRNFPQEFEQFQQSVPRFWPRRGSSRVFESFSMSQYLSNREYNAALGFVGATSVLLLKFIFG